MKIMLSNKINEQNSNLIINYRRKYHSAKIIRLNILMLLLIVFAFLIYSYFTLEYFIPKVHFFLGAIVVLLGVIPLIIYLKQDMKEAVPLLPLTGLFYAFSFGLVGFENVFREFFVTDNTLTYTLLLSIGGLLCLYLGYYVIGNNLFDKTKPFHIRTTASIKTLVFYGWLMESMYIIYITFFRSKLELGSFDQFVDVFSLLGKGILFYLLLTKKLSLKESIIFWLLILFEFLIAFASSHLAWVISLIVFLTIIYVFITKKIPIYAGIIVIVFLFVFQSVKGNYRSYIWGIESSKYSLLDKIELFVNLLSEPNFKKPDRSAASVAFHRMDHLGTTSAVVAETPSIIPYLDGISYLPLVTKFVPRTLWPGKPKEDFGNVWAKWYGLLYWNDYVTSYNLPWLTEFYMNFGLVGVIVGMFLVGILFRYLVNKFCRNPLNILDFLFGLILVITLYAQESNLSLMVGRLIVIFIPLYLTTKLITHSRFKY